MPDVAARRMWGLLEPVHIVTYFTPEARARPIDSACADFEWATWHSGSHRSVKWARWWPWQRSSVSMPTAWTGRSRRVAVDEPASCVGCAAGRSGRSPAEAVGRARDHLGPR